MKVSAYVLKLRHAFSIRFAILRHLPYLFFSSLFLSPCHSLYNFTCLQTHYYSPKIDKKDNRGKEIKKEPSELRTWFGCSGIFFFLLYSSFFSFLQLMYRFFSIGLPLILVRTWNFFFFYRWWDDFSFGGLMRVLFVFSDKRYLKT